MGVARGLRTSCVVIAVVALGIAALGTLVTLRHASLTRAVASHGAGTERLLVLEARLDALVADALTAPATTARTSPPTVPTDDPAAATTTDLSDRDPAPPILTRQVHGFAAQATQAASTANAIEAAALSESLTSLQQRIARIDSVGAKLVGMRADLETERRVLVTAARDLNAAIDRLIEDTPEGQARQALLNWASAGSLAVTQILGATDASGIQAEDAAMAAAYAALDRMRVHSARLEPIHLRPVLQVEQWLVDALAAVPAAQHQARAVRRLEAIRAADRAELRAIRAEVRAALQTVMATAPEVPRRPLTAAMVPSPLAAPAPWIVALAGLTALLALATRAAAARMAGHLVRVRDDVERLVQAAPTASASTTDRVGARLLDRDDAFGDIARALRTLSDRLTMESDAAHRSENRFRSLIYAAPAPIMITRPEDHRILFANRKAGELHGIEPTKLVGMAVIDFYVDPVQRLMLTQALNDSPAGTVHVIDVQLRPCDGPPVWTQVSGTRMMFDGRPAIFSALTDISDRRQREEELREARDRLSEQTRALSAVATDLEVAKREAEEANRAKSAFLAMMSHELRTPLNAILGFSEIIRTEAFGPVGNERYREYADDIFVSGDHLLQLINDILDVSKIEAGKMELQAERVEPEQVVRRAVRLFQDKATAQGVDLRLTLDEAPETAVLDRRAFKQILVNLLSNAIKFTLDAGSVEVRLRAVRHAEQDWLELHVADTGIGIPADQLERVTQPFEQVNTERHRVRGGSGLGLALTKALAELHGGGLAIESTENRGTTVTVVLPLDAAHQAPSGDVPHLPLPAPLPVPLPVPLPDERGTTAAIAAAGSDETAESPHVSGKAACRSAVEAAAQARIAAA